MTDENSFEENIEKSQELRGQAKLARKMAIKLRERSQTLREQLQAQPKYFMEMICSWCGKRIKLMHTAVSHESNLSHGICETCYREVMGDFMAGSDQEEPLLNTFHIGVISDTHGFLRSEAVEALQDSHLIIHAGDVGKPEVLALLRSIAPTVAVRGNVDKDSWAEMLPTTTVVEVGTISLYILHNLKELDLDPVSAGLKAIISGHSHRPSILEREGVLFLNPGSAGPRRFKLPVSVALLQIQLDTLKAELIELAV